jgi:hypothetical protein
MRELAKLRALTGAERRFLAKAVVATTVVAGALPVFGFRRLHGALARSSRRRELLFTTPGSAGARAKTAAKLVAIAAGRGPVRATCLRRSLVLWWLLRRDGIETVLRVGVNRDSGSLEAHAWVEFQGRPLGDDDDIATRFPAFDRDFGAPVEPLA